MGSENGESNKAVEEAKEMLVSTMRENPYCFIKAIQRMMGQAAYDVFMIMEHYRAVLHDKSIPGNVIIQEPKRPEDTPMGVKINTLLAVIAEARGEADGQTDDYDKILKVAKEESEEED